MSQMLICKSKCDLSNYGQLINCSVPIADFLVSSVVNRYFTSPFDDLWLIVRIEEWVLDIKKNLDSIMKLAELSDSMVFWYSDMFEDLDEITTLSELKESILASADVYDPELYLHVLLK